ncbi:MAG TPA: aminotransferase class III-fold pyridoxal phosphate-dependent enzyme [Gemmatimonadaceae bacterium]|nr:aminotransferase class III-fold pyridoxal phosphate-dependent enzyme [Gemmatimonadaceae bacterium]
MAFSRFFGRGRDAVPPAEPQDTGTEQPGDASDDAEAPKADESSPESASQRGWRERAEAVLPTGASTGSKRAAALWGDDPDRELPTHLLSARRCRVVDVEGTSYVDCTMGLGSVALGYAEPRVTRAVVDAASEGNIGALSSWREVELAERLHALIPVAERVQFLKTGAEATSAAVRLARTYTGRERVVASGYFGWHDWSSDTDGIPSGAKAGTVRVPFDDVVALERAVGEAGKDLAAVVLEPIVERLPSEGWLRRARELCDASGAALVFDEIKTGFRVAPAGYQELSGITPDLATYGKALSNGYPLAALVGRAPLMEAARRTWISSTLASESIALAAALAVLDWHEEADICATLAETGRELRAILDRAIAASGVEGVSTDGVDTMFLLRWDDPAREAHFLAESVRAGVIFKRGAYNFAAIAHDDEALREIEAAASGAFVALADRERSR